MKRFRISLRSVVGLVAAVSVVFAIDQYAESNANTLVAEIILNPDRMLPNETQPDWVGGVAVQNTIDTSSFADRILFRRKLSVHYNKGIDSNEKEQSYTAVDCISTFSVTLFGSKQIDQSEKYIGILIDD